MFQKVAKTTRFENLLGYVTLDTAFHLQDKCCV